MIPILFGDVFSNSDQRITTNIRYPNPIPLIIVRIKAARSVLFILEIIPFIGIPKSSPEASIISRKIFNCGSILISLVHGVTLVLSLGNNTTSLTFPAPVSTISRRATPNPQPA
mgnify:CR=1 FL=1